MHSNKSKSIFYPGAGNDYALIKHFIKNTEHFLPNFTVKTFYYCDYLNRDFRPESILSDLKEQLKGSKIEYIASLQPAYFNQANWGDFWSQEFDGNTNTGRKENSFIALYRITFLNKVFELYYFCTEANETYRILLENNIKIDLVITKEHGRDGHGANFDKGSYLEAIARRNHKMPRYLLVGVDFPAWEGYERISEPFGAFGVHEHPRIMYELTSQNVDFFEFKERYTRLNRNNLNLINL